MHVLGLMWTAGIAPIAPPADSVAHKTQTAFVPAIRLKYRSVTHAVLDPLDATAEIRQGEGERERIYDFRQLPGCCPERLPRTWVSVLAMLNCQTSSPTCMEQPLGPCCSQFA